MYGCSVDRIDLRMYAAAVQPEIAETLRTEPGTPAFCIVRRFFDRDSRMYEVSVALHPAGRFSYAMHLRRQCQTGQGGRSEFQARGAAQRRVEGKVVSHRVQLRVRRIKK